MLFNLLIFLNDLTHYEIEVRYIGFADVSQAINSRGVSARITWGVGPTVTVEITGNAGYGEQAHWRIRGVNPDTSEYIKDTNDQRRTFNAEDGKSYAFQAVWGSRSNGAVFTVKFDNSGDSGSSGGATIEPIHVTASDIYFGDRCNVTWTPSSASSYYKLDFSIGSYSYETGVLPGASSYSGWTIPLTSAENIPDSDYGLMTVTVTQYSDRYGSNETGSYGNTSFRVTLPDSVVPSISSCSLAIDNTSNDVLKSWNVALAGYTRVNITAKASGVYGSTISSYSIAGDYNTTVRPEDGTSSLNYTGDIIISPGNKSFIITCTDSRGRSSKQFATSDQLGVLTFLSYKHPKLTKFVIDKNSNGKLQATADWTIDTVNNLNSATVTLYYKTSASESWWTCDTNSPIKPGAPVEINGITLSDKNSYNFKIIVTDTLGNSASKTSFTSTAEVLLDFQAGGKGLGIGKICESAGMEVSMDATFYNGLYLLRDAIKYDIDDYIEMITNNVVSESLKSIGQTIINTAYPVGSIYISMSTIEPKVLFGVGEWERIEDRFLIGAGIDEDYSYLLGDTGGSYEVALTTEELPTHSHDMVYSTNNGASYSKATMGKDGSFSDQQYLAFSNSAQEFKSYMVEISESGGGEAHENMPPFIAVYMWKRVA